MTDRRFPRGGANPRRGANLLLDQFSRKLFENEEILGHGWDNSHVLPRSATEDIYGILS